MKPPAPGPVSGLSATQETSAAPTAASTAFPPAPSTSAPACAVSGCPAATTPLMGRRLSRHPASAARYELWHVKLLGRPRSSRTRDARLAVGRDVAPRRVPLRRGAHQRLVRVA